MDRYLKNTALYQGLFLLAFGLYASERLQARESIVLKKTEAEIVSLSTEPGLRAIEILYRDLKSTPLFQTPIDGLRLKQTGSRISIILQSDELYSGENIAIEETWHPVLDRIAESVFPKLGEGFQVRIQGFKELGDESGGVSAFRQESAYALATSRAEWLIHYFETKVQTRSKMRFWVGAGLSTSSKRLEMTIELK
jgi:hypothetical protein